MNFVVLPTDSINVVVFSGGQRKSHMNCQNTSANGIHIPWTESIKLNASLYSIVIVISETFFSLQR